MLKHFLNANDVIYLSIIIQIQLLVKLKYTNAKIILKDGFKQQGSTSIDHN